MHYLKGILVLILLKKLALFALTTGAMTALGFFFDSGALVNEIAQFFTYIKSFMFFV